MKISHLLIGIVLVHGCKSPEVIVEEPFDCEPIVISNSDAINNVISYLKLDPAEIIFEETVAISDSTTRYWSVTIQGLKDRRPNLHTASIDKCTGDIQYLPRR